jgi:hypothetical protein
VKALHPWQKSKNSHYKNFRKNVKPVLELFQEVYDSIEMVVYLFARRFAQVDNMGKLSLRGLRAGALIARRTPLQTIALASMLG